MDFDDFKVIAVAIVLVVSLFIGLAWLMNLAQIHSCDQVGKQSIETKWGGFWVGCLVKPGNEWIPIDNWREIK